jgi:hypothetical protein
MARSFWTDAKDEHREIAKEFYQNIEYDHPGSVSSDRLSPYSPYGTWNTTAVKYYRYTGPRVTKLK